MTNTVIITSTVKTTESSSHALTMQVWPYTMVYRKELLWETRFAQEGWKAVKRGSSLSKVTDLFTYWRSDPKVSKMGMLLFTWKV